MTRHKHAITIERENEQYFAYSEDLLGVYGVGASIEETKASIVESIRLHEAHTAHRFHGPVHSSQRKLQSSCAKIKK
jgi:predicted RNase H-like HicB family nuclease